MGAGGSNQGFSLVELMLALAMGLIVVAGMTQLFAGSKETYALLGQQARLQESGRYALKFIGTSARGAGYLGCNARPERIVNTLNGDLSALFEVDLETPVQAFDADGGGSAAAFAGAAGIDADQVTPGTDIVVLRRLAGPAYRVAAPVAGSDNVVVKDREPFDLEADDFVLIGDCQQSSLFRISGVIRGAGNATLLRDGGAGAYDNAPGKALSAPGKIYGSAEDAGAATVARVLTETYFIAEGRGVESRGEPSRSLWRRAGTSPSAELVEGIHDLRVSFAVDTEPQGGVADVNRHVGFNEMPPGDIIRAMHVQVTAGEPPNQRAFGQTFSLRNAW